MVAVSVVVAASNPGSALPGLVRSVDGQTLPAADFELVVADASRDGSAARLEQIAGSRPNVTVVPADPATTEADRIGAALEQATGERVLVLGQRQRLAPRALELLLDRALRADADVVVGRAVTGAASGCALLPDDAEALDPAGLDLSSCVALVRRTLLEGLANPGAALLDLPSLTAAAATVGGVGRYACAIATTRRGAQGEGVALDPPAYRWAAGELHLTVGVRPAQPLPPEARAWLVLAHAGAEIAVPARVERREAEPAGASVAVAIDPRTAEAGGPLEDGLWALAVRLALPGREVTVPVGAGPARSAVLDGRPYVARGLDGVLQLDAGATVSSAIGPVTKDRAAVTESVRGALLTFQYPTVHVQGDGVLDARLLLDAFRLPAHLVCEDGRARLEAYIGSLAGSSLVSVVAGGGAPVRTGLRLRVDGAGRMTFQTAPPPRPAPAPGRRGGPLVQRLRHRLPGVLEPVVSRLSRVPVLRQAYRRLIRL